MNRSHPTTSRKKHLLTLQGIVEAPVDRVTPLVLSVPATEGATVEIDPSVRTVAVQGGWWYRGETSVTQAPGGSLITQKIYDVAQWMRWAVPLASRIPLREAPATFTRRLETVGRRLGVNAYPLSPDKTARRP
ncbi:hypothetical protein ACFXKW_20910 [Streptomyces sp. NPDC059193]|uniref:hypothetical protein n=1 Tax=Streptomyces sp. NPDC059193 TaxID=3346763 RepID=UPI00367D86EE